MDRPIRSIHFNALPTAVRRRFVGALAGSEPPVALVAYPEGSVGPAIGWGLVSVIGLVGLGALVAADFGNTVAHTQPWTLLAAWGLAFFLAIYGVLAATRAIVRGRSVPFRSGRYLFPLDFVIAKGGDLELLSTAAISNVRTVHHYRNGVYGGTNVAITFGPTRVENFWFTTQAKAQAALDGLRDSQFAIRDAVARRDVEAIRRLDLFLDVRGTPELDDPAALASYRERNEREGAQPIALAIPGVLTRAAIVALVPAVVLAGPAYWVRNYASDEAAFARVSNQGSFELQMYLDSGGRHADEVRNTLLPAAVYAEAIRSRTVSALRAFIERFPRAPQVRDARAAIHQRFVEAHASFVAQAPANPELAGFMQRLLHFLEAHDTPKVLVRFTAPSAEALAAEDADLARRGRREGGHEVMPIAPHFTPDRTSLFEGSVTNRLRDGFATVFPADIFDLEHSGRVDASAPLDPNHPVLDVRYVVRPSGALYVSDTDTRAFVGIHVDFDVTMRSPDGPGTFAFAFAVEPPETFTVSTRGDAQASDNSIYATMAERAFDRLGERLSSTFFAQAQGTEAGK